MRRGFVSLALGSTVMLAAATPALADRAGPDVPPHRHFIVKPTGEWVEVGPRVCDNPQLQEGFNQFHHNVHLGTPNTFAFDHPHNPVDLMARPCAFQP